MVAFNEQLSAAVVLQRLFGRAGAPWEFNLRDVLRWAELAEHSLAEPHADTLAIDAAVAAHFPTVYLHRLRTDEDRRLAAQLFAAHFPRAPRAWPLPSPALRVSREALHLGVARLPRALSAAAASPGGGQLSLLRGQMRAAEAAAAALSHGWMVSLVGPSASGKTSLARVLAILAGATLHEVRFFAALRRAASEMMNNTHSALSERAWPLRTKVVTFPILPAALLLCRSLISATSRYYY
jgi:midasin